MNYEELVNSKVSIVGQVAKTPLGLFRRVMVDGKGVNRIRVRAELADSIGFVGGLNKELERNVTLKDSSQIHFHRMEDGELEAGPGVYRSFGRMLAEKPAVVARPGFINTVVEELLRITADLNSVGIFHVCFAPDNVFVRGGDSNIMLLSHGSFYLNTVEPSVLYEGFGNYVAPEVLDGGTVDARCDVYSIGKFLEYIFAMTEMPYEFKAVIAKATREVPEDRYDSVDDMKKALQRRRAGKATLRTFGVAMIIALVIVGVIFSLSPDERPVEYVKPVATQNQPEDMLDKGFDPTTELGVSPTDSTLVEMSPEQQEQMKEYEAKCEKIFRKRYAAEADRILSKIYNKSYMGSNEKKFVAGSKSVMDELVKAQEELAVQTHLSSSRSQRIASEIIDEVSERKKATLTQYGIKKPQAE